MSKNRTDDALKIFNAVAKVNKRKLDENLWKEYLATEVC
jgi:hypothetical protein